jgi:hypothetical protein
MFTCSTVFKSYTFVAILCCSYFLCGTVLKELHFMQQGALPYLVSCCQPFCWLVELASGTRWLPRSPRLNLCYFILWTESIQEVYLSKARTYDKLEQRVRENCSTVDSNENIKICFFFFQVAEV